MTYPQDHSQQLQAYLGAWRQLLEPLLTIPPGLPPMPPPAPAAPLQGDYSQQLFGYLQGWRQYLEQMTGARPTAPQTAGPQPPVGGTSPPDVRRSAWPTNPVAPDDPGAGSSTASTATGTAGSSETSWPPEKIALKPSNETGTQATDYDRIPVRPEYEGGNTLAPSSLFNRAAVVARGPLRETPPPVEGPQDVNAIRRRPGAAELSARPAPATSAAKAARHDAATPVPAVRESLFKGLVERTNSLGGG